MSNSNVIKELNILTTISENTLNKLLDKVYYIISDTIEESLLNNQDIAECDIGLGTLMIKLCGEEVKFKFIPNAKLQEIVKSTIVNKKNLLSATIEKTLVDRITNTYKDLLR